MPLLRTSVDKPTSTGTPKPDWVHDSTPEARPTMVRGRPKPGFENRSTHVRQEARFHSNPWSPEETESTPMFLTEYRTPPYKEPGGSLISIACPPSPRQTLFATGGGGSCRRQCKPGSSRSCFRIYSMPVGAPRQEEVPRNVNRLYLSIIVWH